MRKLSKVLVVLIIMSFVFYPMPASKAYMDKPFLHPLFSDHMVLQRDAEDAVWGWTNPGEKVTVEIGGKTSTCAADSNGKWLAKVGPFSKGGPYEMKVTGSQTVTVKDILFGEVWFCAGQSNMLMQLPFAANGEVEVQNANYPNIRYLSTPYQSTSEPKETFGYVSTWQPCTPQTVGNLTAAGYYFARQLTTDMDVPVGIICSSVGGSFIESWISNDAFKTFMATVPSGYQPSSTNVFYNGMVAPVTPFTVKGIMWYQGESNTQFDYLYGKQLNTMVKDWRLNFKQGDLPFMIIQLPSYQKVQTNPVENTPWTIIREAQLMTVLGDSNSGLVTTIDIGAEDIHPKNKQDVGKRAAICAEGKFYGKNIVYSGPIYKSMTVNGNQVKISFDHAGSGLTTGVKTGLAPVQLNDGGTLKGFAIAGADGKFVWADAIIQNDMVVVSSSSVANPVTVRYSWADNPIGNLYNKEGLPASPFRTDVIYPQVSVSPTPTLTWIPSPTPTKNPTPAPTTTSAEPDMPTLNVNTTFNPQSLASNQMMTAKVSVKDVTPGAYSGTKDVLLIVGLFDRNNTMVNVSYISKGITYQGSETLAAGFKLPTDVSGYTVKAFVWDGVDIKTSNMIPLSNVTQLP